MGVYGEGFTFPDIPQGVRQLQQRVSDPGASSSSEEVREIAGVKVLSLHHDISTVTGEEVVLFTLAESPLFRETRKKERV